MLIIRISFEQFGETPGKLEMGVIEMINPNDVEVATYEAIQAWFSEMLGEIIAEKE